MTKNIVLGGGCHYDPDAIGQDQVLAGRDMVAREVGDFPSLSCGAPDIVQVAYNVLRQRLNRVVKDGGEMVSVDVDGRTLMAVSTGGRVAAVLQGNNVFRSSFKPEIDWRGVVDCVKSVDSRGRVCVPNSLSDEIRYVLFRRGPEVAGVLLNRHIDVALMDNGSYFLQEVRVDKAHRVLLSFAFFDKLYKDGKVQVRLKGHKHFISFHVEEGDHGLTPAELQKIDIAWMVS